MAAKLAGGAASTVAMSTAAVSMGDAKDHSISMWAAKWSHGQPDWHEREANEHLRRHIHSLMPVRLQCPRVLVPLCGQSVDMMLLNSAGWEVWGVEGVKSAAEGFFVSQRLHATSVPPGAAVPGATVIMAAQPMDAVTVSPTSKGEQVSPPPPLRVAVGNFFALHHEALGTFDAAWDRGSFVAIHPSMRDEYVRVMRNRIRPGGRVLLEAWCHERAAHGDAPEGPPHSASPAEVAAAWGSSFSVELLEQHPVMGRGGRFSSGWSVSVYILTRQDSPAQESIDDRV